MPDTTEPEPEPRADPAPPAAAKPGRIAARKRRRLPPALLRPDDAAAYVGLGRSTLDRLSAAGLVPEPVRIGGAIAWSRHELAAWAKRKCPDRATWAATWQALLAAEAGSPARRR